MAAEFDNTSDRLTGETFTPPAAGTVSLWWYPTFVITDGANHFAFSVRNAGSSNYWDFSKNTANNLVFVVGGEATFAVSPTGFTQNQWNHCLVTWDDSANTREIFVGGTSLGSSALAFNLSGLAETLHIGNLRSDVLSVDARGRISDFCIWNKILSADERASLLKYEPGMIAPSSILRNFDLTRDFKEKRVGAAITNSGVTVAEGPPLIRRRRRKVA